MDLDVYYTLGRQRRDRIENLMAVRREHLERFAAAFVKQVGETAAASYQLEERTEHHEGGMTVTWEFVKIPMTNAIQEVIDKMAEVDRTIAQIGTEAIAEQAAKVFEALPGVTAIAWQQYTPSFNDGDPCVFSRTDVSISRKMVTANEDGDILDADGEIIDDLDDTESFRDTWSTAYDLHPNDDTARKAEQERLNEALAPITAIPDEIMLRLFGDGQQIVVFRGGIVKVSDYDCDY